MSSPLEDFEQVLQHTLGATVIGMEGVIRSLTIAIIARGHVLIQGAPGLGKTLLSKTLAVALGGSFKRIQGTADLMPSDIIGVHVFDSTRNEFVFRPGPLFAEVLLFDEINRAGPKTQSALLEAMEERQVSVERKQYRLPANFLVVATQNPRDFEGTYPLPESQLDRFMLRVELSYPSREHESKVMQQYGAIITDTTASSAAAPAAVASAQLLLAARQRADTIHVASELVGYVLDIARASREHTQLTLGLSTRGALALLRAARISAGLRGSEFVSPDDVKSVASQVVPHRLMLSSEAMLEGTTEVSVLQRLLDQVPVPR
jgi:MoxR-like ATPase